MKTLRMLRRIIAQLLVVAGFMVDGDAAGEIVLAAARRALDPRR